ncbi:MAG: hypothetical protein RBR07_05195 [Arcobacteraceae bacterium]|nr:hypothetical protein [Arcobacteraceae bacterium]
MKKIFLMICSVTFLFASSTNISLMNNIKTVIQKEEYIALAINKYIAQTRKIPKKSNNKLDWDKLIKDDLKSNYLGKSFDNTNPITSEAFEVIFDTDNNCFIQGVFTQVSSYNEDYKYLYNFYTNKLFRINTNPPKSSEKDDLIKGSLVVYGKFQKDIVNIITNTSSELRLPSEKCPTNNYYYELRNQEVVYKYCRGDYSFDIYQKAPIYLENWEDLAFIKATVGDVAYVKKNGQWYEYIYQGDVDISWIPVESGSALTSQDDTLDVEDRLISYIPDAKDLVLRRDGGCMLANGDIFCWGNNDYKKAGIESFGQLDHNLSPDYINTPVMLKVQIEDATQKTKKWYNNPYRVKFEKMSMNSTNVCGISPIFDYFQSGVYVKFGGDLYCNGQISSQSFEDIGSTVSQSSILRKHKFFANGKEDHLNNANEIYLVDIAMVEDTIAVLSDDGKIYTFGRNYQGALGIDNSDKFINQITPVAINNNSQVFKKIFALRDIRGFGAIDTNNNFWMWGERANGAVHYEPTLLSSGKKFNPDMIFVNSSDFVLKGMDNIYYRTDDSLDFRSLSFIPNSALSLSIYDALGEEFYLYVDENMQLKGSTDLTKCRLANETSSCTSNSSNVFDLALEELNTKSNSINGKSYANFANAAIFKLDHIVTEVSDDFEEGETNSKTWTVRTYSDVNFTNQTSSTNANDYLISATEATPNTTILSITDRVDPTRILGRFLLAKQSIEKTYNLGTSFANFEVEVEFDFFEIDSWDMERLQVFLNNVLITEDGFIHDAHEDWTDTNDSGIYTLNLGTHYNDGIFYVDGEPYSRHNDQKYRYKLKGKLDSAGKLKVLIRVRELKSSDYGYNKWAYAQDVEDESWGIDNVHIKVKETNKKFVCSMTGLGSKSQMYCWGNIARSIPILSTSLYDVSKIPTMNKLFVSQESDRKSQMSYGEYYNDGKLFLKYPTYIGGFDYEFYFK